MVSYQHIKKGFFLFLFFMISSASADPNRFPLFTTPYYHGFEFSASSGPQWIHASNARLVVSPTETDRARVQHLSNDAAWKLGVGYYFFLKHLLLELNLYQTSGVIKGIVWQYQSPQFNNYRFKSSVSSTRLMIDVKPILFTWQRFSPYAILGVGPTWNHASYRESPVQSGGDPSGALSLSRRTQTHVAWDVGAGFDVALTRQISATMEYVYAFLGDGSASTHSQNAVHLIKSPCFSLQTQMLLFGLRFTV